ncbi:DUF6634 family protein [Bosea sp. Tri-44]|uniref:DUF6634 family protein n=1 Tax=Bosea sp. Tri-44 TaxID=1972137 RepID=UPI0019D6C15C|nr:DUF6634 family protein [Bosea sp. Tri-44]
MRELVEKITAASADLRRLEKGWLPSGADLSSAVTLEGWVIGVDPQTNQTVFWGRSIGHPILGDRLIMTSPVLWVSKDRTIARTLSRWYRLGKPAELALHPCGSDPDDQEPVG